MRRLAFPSPFEHADVSSYFSDFVSKNSKRSFFSHRFVSRKLKWPLSYLNELIRGRKRLTCLRAIEFSEFAGFTPLETEGLILLGIQEGVPQSMRERVFSRDTIKTRSQYRMVNTPADPNQQLLCDFQAMVVLEILKWLRGRSITAQTIVNYGSTVQLTLTEAEIALQNLERHGVIRRRTAGNFEILQERIWFDEYGQDAPGIRLHQRFAESFIQFCQAPQGPALYNAALVELERSEFNYISDKIVALRDWIRKKSDETYAKPKVAQTDTLLFQLDLNLFPVVRREEVPLPQCLQTKDRSSKALLKLGNKKAR